jgi:hypothetical protein
MSTTDKSYLKPFTIEGSKSALVEFRARAGTRPKPAKDKNTKEWALWGTDNCQPKELSDLILNNNLNTGIINTKIDFTVANGVSTYRKITDTDGKVQVVPYSVPEVDAFFAANDIPELMRKWATDLHWYGNFFPELLFNAEGRVNALNHIDATYVRSGKMNDDGVVTTFFISSDWKNAKFDPENAKASTVKRVPGLFKQPEYRYGRAILHVRDYVPGYPYYSPPTWWGTRDYISLANRIPVWHDNALENGYNLKYHIIIPESYFDQFAPEERQEKRNEIRTQMDKFLSGTDNPMKSFISFSQRFDDKTADKWEIVALENNMSDTAYTSLFDQTNTATISGHGIDPTLCGIETQGKLSSGSEKRIAAELYQKWKTTRPRQLLLKVLQWVKEINGWPKELIFGFEDIQLTTLDANPTGSQAVVQTPAQ